MSRVLLKAALHSVGVPSAQRLRGTTRRAHRKEKESRLIKRVPKQEAKVQAPSRAEQQQLQEHPLMAMSRMRTLL